jgi:hypothetical protein
MSQRKLRLSQRRGRAAESIKNRLRGISTGRRDLSKHPYTLSEIEQLKSELFSINSKTRA